MRFAGRSSAMGGARLLVLPAIAIAGCATWMLLPWPSEAESPLSPASSAVVRVAQDASSTPDQPAPTQATLANPAPSTEAGPAIATAPPLDISPPETTVPAKPPVERRGGLGSKALMTFTLRNANDYPVKDIEIACAFARRDGSHLTDRRRVIPDTVSMKSQKRYSGMLIGFVNVNADKAKCSLVTASRS